MSWRHHGHGRGRAGYHHGNLREALIEAALALIPESGPLGFTFAEAARQAGVSPAAPYRHFRDRDHLLADIAQQGFDRFAEALTAAWSDGAPDPMTAFCNIGKAYLTFARTQPGYYAAMFEAGIALDATPELREAGDRAFAILRDAAERVIASLPQGKRPPALMVALHVWSLSHGIASLFGGRTTPVRAMPMSPEDLLEAGVLVQIDEQRFCWPGSIIDPANSCETTTSFFPHLRACWRCRPYFLHIRKDAGARTGLDSPPLSPCANT